jgi:protein gp37
MADVFEDWPGPIHDHKGNWLYYDGTCGDCVPVYLPLKPGADKKGRTLVAMDDLRRDLFALIDATPNLDWLLLTKRPENILKMWPGTVEVHEAGAGRRSSREVQRFRDNVWLGTSVSEQETADRNIPELLKCRDLAPVLFVSYEPALSHVFFLQWAFDWLIIGGESGPGARPFNVEWARGAIKQCRRAKVACFVKQLGAAPYDPPANDFDWENEVWRMNEIKDSKGGDWSEWPEDLRVRQFPTVNLPLTAPPA